MYENYLTKFQSIFKKKYIQRAMDKQSLVKRAKLAEIYLLYGISYISQLEEPNTKRSTCSRLEFFKLHITRVKTQLDISFTFT